METKMRVMLMDMGPSGVARHQAYAEAYHRKNGVACNTAYTATMTDAEYIKSLQGLGLSDDDIAELSGVANWKEIIG